VSNGVGAVAGIVLPPPIAIPIGLTIAAIDAFLLERLAPKDAVLSILSEIDSLVRRR